MSKSCKTKTSGKSGGKQPSKTKSQSQSSKTNPSTKTISDESGIQSSKGWGDDFNIEVMSRDNDELYGCGSCTPEWLQFCRRTPVVFLVVMSLMVFAHMFIQVGVIPASLSTWQRRFRFDSIDLAYIRSMFEVGGCLILLPVIYFGDQNIRRPQWISVGCFLVGLGAVIMAMPHFLINRYTHVHDHISLCKNETNETIESTTRSYEKSNKDNDVKYIFMLGELLIGMGHSASYLLGLTYLDENVSARLSGVYTAILEMCFQIGTVVGFLTMGQVLKISGDIDKGASWVGSYDYRQHDWYGAWWIGVLIGAVLAWIGAALIFPFPQQLSGAIVARIRDAQEAALTKSDKSYEVDTQAKNYMQWWMKVKNLLCNFVYVGTAIEECSRSFLVAGFVFFSATYLETMFDTNKSSASSIVGGLLCSAALIGVCYGSIVQYVLNLEVLGNLRLCAASAFGALIFSLCFLVQCKAGQFEGDNDPNGPLHFNLPCSMNCHCTTDQFEPICFQSKGLLKQVRVTYFSACYAGCVEMPNKTYFNCHCLKDMSGTVEEGRCKCNEYRLYAFLVLLCWLGILRS